MKIGSLVLSAVTVVSLAGCDASDPSATAATSPVPFIAYVVTPIRPDDMTFLGSVQPQIKTDKVFPATGKVASVNVKMGDMVKAGDTLATVDSSMLEWQLHAAEAQLKGAEAQLETARMTAFRQSELVRQGVNSAAAVETADGDVASALSTWDSARAKLEKAKTELGRTRLTADYDGVVLNVGLQTGQFATPSAGGITIARNDLLDAVIDIPHELAQTLKPGAHGRIVSALDRSVAVEGVVREISPASDDATASYRVYLKMTDPGGAFRIGTLIRAVFTSQASAQIRIPESALLRKGDAVFVWLFDPASTSLGKTPVTVGRPDNGMVEVTAGLTPGSIIVAAGVHSPRNGQIVTPVAERAR